MERLVRLWALGLALVLVTALPVVGEECVTLKTPELVDIIEGDRQVELWWRDVYPESLTCVHQPKLGTTQSPWRGNAGMTSGGFYTGGCDFDYRFTVVISDSVRFRWTEVNWITGAQTRKTLTLLDTDTSHDLSDGMTVSVPAGTLFTITGSEMWTPADPAFHGIYTGGADTTADEPVVFTFSCSVGGDVSGTGGSAAVVGWTDGEGGSGSIDLEASGVDYEVTKGLKVNFPAGTYVAGDTLEMEALRPFVINDQFSISVETFDGYQVLRRSVEDRPDVYKVIANIERCDTAAFFLPVDDIRYFMDKGIRSDEEGVTPDPDAPTVINGFPYYYAVVTYDVSDDPQTPGMIIRSHIVDSKVYPSPPVGNSVEDVFVVPNPYLFTAGWEESANGSSESKLQFFNVPQGAQIVIYDVTGQYIQTVSPEMLHDGESQSGRAEWNLKNASGREVVGGVYIYYVTAGGNEKVGRFVVIR
jgi:hypothetical protein